MLNEYHDAEDNEEDTRVVQDDAGWVTLALPAALMEKLERLAVAKGRSVDEEAVYILKVILGLRAADPNDRVGREIAMIHRRMRSHHPLDG